ncbi:MAG: hypothetical protein ACXV8P_10980 [Methylobacter sp.]
MPENKGHYGTQAVESAPTQGVIIAEEGLFPIAIHAFNFVRGQ